jgi:uncharacterized membrane protein
MSLFRKLQKAAREKYMTRARCLLFLLFVFVSQPIYPVSRYVSDSYLSIDIQIYRLTLFPGEESEVRINLFNRSDADIRGIVLSVEGAGKITATLSPSELEILKPQQGKQVSMKLMSREKGLFKEEPTITVYAKTDLITTSDDLYVTIQPDRGIWPIIGLGILGAFIIFLVILFVFIMKNKKGEKS